MTTRIRKIIFPLALLGGLSAIHESNATTLDRFYPTHVGEGAYPDLVDDIAGTLMIHFASHSPSTFKGMAPGHEPEPAPTAQPVVRVSKWDRFEAAVTNLKSCSNKYKDVTLNVTYTKPDGSTIKFWGFYDGDSTWKIRFMPDQLGAWKFDARFSDGTPGCTGEFECVPSDLPGMLTVYEPNPLWFGYKNGEAVFIRSFHVGDCFFASNLPPESRKAFLDWAKGQGYNMLSIASHYLNRDAEGRGKGWETPKLWPLNAEEYRKMEKILDDLANRRVFVFPFAGFFGQKSNYPRDPGDQEMYIRYTLARIGPYWNLLFNVAGPEPNLGNRWMEDSVVIRLGKQIRDLDIFRHPISVHNRTGDDPYRDSDWTDYGVLQGPKTVDRKKLSAGILKNHHPAKPLYAQETLWTGNTHHPPYTDADIRKNAYVIAMSAAAFCFADNKGHSSTGFSGTLDFADCRQPHHDIVKRVLDFFGTVPFQRMKPHQELVDNGYCLAEPGNMYLVYLESPGTVNIQVSGGQYKVEWINAQNPHERRAGGTTSDGKDLKSPDYGDDWLVMLCKNPASY